MMAEEGEHDLLSLAGQQQRMVTVGQPPNIIEQIAPGNYAIKSRKH